MLSAAATTCDDALATLSGVLGRSLLQYVAQAGVWTSSQHAAAKASLHELAAAQRQSFADVADLLVERHVLPDSLGYPSEFATLHYLSLEFVTDRLIANQIGVVAAIDDAIDACRDEPVVASLEAIRNREALHLDRLREIAASFRQPPLA